MSARARTSVGATQSELAARAGVSDRTVRRYEAGRRVTPDTMRRIEEALRIERGDVPPAIRDREFDGRPMRIPALDTGVPGARVDMRVARHGDGWAVWWPSAPHALGLDGTAVDTSATAPPPFTFAAFSHAVAAACVAAERGEAALAGWHSEGRGPSPGDRYMWFMNICILLTGGVPLPEALSFAAASASRRVAAADLPDVSDPARPASIDPGGVLARLLRDGADRRAMAEAMQGEANCILEASRAETDLRHRHPCGAGRVAGMATTCQPG